MSPRGGEQKCPRGYRGPSTWDLGSHGKLEHLTPVIYGMKGKYQEARLELGRAGRELLPTGQSEGI